MYLCIKYKISLISIFSIDLHILNKMVVKYKRIQKQLLAFKKFQEITKAIRFVAGGELGRLRKDIRRRFTALTSIVPLFEKKFYPSEYESTLVVAITDDRGSCGPHNNNVIYSAQDLVSSLEDLNKNLLIYTLGKKAKVFFKKFYKKYFVGYGCNLRDIRYSIDSCYFILLKIVKYSFDRCFLVFNRYFSIQLQKALGYQLCSYNDFIENIMTRSNTQSKGSIFFNSIKNKNVYNNFAKDLYYFGSSLLLQDALEDNKYSFLAGRFNAMDNAIKNSTDIIELLTLLYNKARQEYITTELIEIISCKEAIMSDEVVFSKTKEEMRAIRDANLLLANFKPNNTKAAQLIKIRNKKNDFIIQNYKKSKTIKFAKTKEEMKAVRDASLLLVNLKPTKAAQLAKSRNKENDFKLKK